MITLLFDMRQVFLECLKTKKPSQTKSYQFLNWLSGSAIKAFTFYVIF
jgi:hypothetical protein